VKGSYLLICRLDAPLRQLAVGRFGSFDFAAGHYIYVGSAMGSGGLEARLAHHRLRDKPRPHWHIDYLRPHLHLLETWAVSTNERLECVWCRALAATPGFEIPVAHFGSRDTGCAAHLFFSERRPALRQLTAALIGSLPLSGGHERELLIEIATYDD
jgi:Uri superfamily endonuclease